MNETTTQKENLAKKLPVEKKEAENKVRIPFRTALVLTREQEDSLVEWACRQVENMEKELGRVVDKTNAQGEEQGKAAVFDAKTHFGKREMLTARYYNHVEDRAVPKTVYQHSNFTASLSQRITMQMVARLKKFFLGEPDDTDWFSTEAVGVEDAGIAESTKKHSRWKCDQCDVKPHLGDAIEYAGVRGESVTKATHQMRSQIYKRVASVLVDAKNEPILDAHGDYIVEGDAWVEQVALVPMPPPVAVPELGNTGENEEAGLPPETATAPATAAVPTGGRVLKRDGVTPEPEFPIYEEQVIARRLITFEGPDAPVIYFKDFLAPLNAADIQTAECIAHIYDMDVMQVAELFQGQIEEGDAGLTDLTAAAERLRAMLSESSQPKATAQQPRADFNEKPAAGPDAAICEIAECWATYDADGDGIREEIMLVLDRRRKAPIYYEYTANVTVKGMRPFYVHRPIKIDGRWWGMGFMEYFDPEQSFIDLTINRHNFATSKAGTTTFWDPSLTLEGARDGDLILHEGRTYTKRPGVKTEDVLSYVQLPNDSENLEYLLDLFMQLMQLKSGVTNGADQAQVNLPTPDTATGINEIHDSGQELFSHFVGNYYVTLKRALGGIIDLIYANMNRAEVFSYFNGEGQEILQLTPEDVRDLALNVSLVLSKSQQRKALETGVAADQLIDGYYARAPILQERTAQFARGRLKALGVSQADKVIEPLTPMLPAEGDPNTGLPESAPSPPAQSAV